MPVTIDGTTGVTSPAFIENSTNISPIGKQTIWIPAAAMTTQTTSGPAAATLEMNTNKNMISYLAFDSTATEGAQFSIQMPKSWNESTLVGQAVWTHPTTTVNFGVVWSLRGVATANNDTLDVAFGSYANTTSQGGTANATYISPETSAITVAGAPGAEEYVTFQVNRHPANASDTLGVDAYLLGVKLHYTIDLGNDS